MDRLSPPIPRLVSTFRNAPRSPPVLLDIVGEVLGMAGGPCSIPDAVLKASCILEETRAVLLHRPVKSLVGGKIEGPFARLGNRKKRQIMEKDKNIGVFYQILQALKFCLLYSQGLQIDLRNGFWVLTSCTGIQQVPAAFCSLLKTT